MEINIRIGSGNAYLRQFQVAQLNLAKLMAEERMNKRIKSSKKKSSAHD
jgi:hypothetical protein